MKETSLIPSDKMNLHGWMHSCKIPDAAQLELHQHPPGGAWVVGVSFQRSQIVLTSKTASNSNPEGLIGSSMNFHDLL